MYIGVRHAGESRDNTAVPGGNGRITIYYDEIHNIIILRVYVTVRSGYWGLITCWKRRDMHHVLKEWLEWHL